MLARPSSGFAGILDQRRTSRGAAVLALPVAGVGTRILPRVANHRGGQLELRPQIAGFPELSIRPHKARDQARPRTPGHYL